MNRAWTEGPEGRLIVLAPVGKDAALVQKMLGPGVACTTCLDAETLRRELKLGAAAVLLTEEPLPWAGSVIAEAIACQPPWSDLPVLLLTGQGANSKGVAAAVDKLGNLTLLERPVRVAALSSAVHSALRARERQYRMREYLEERELADRRKDEFMAVLAHELRNPLAPIRNSVRLLSLGDATSNVVPMIERQLNHLVRLVDDLMEMSRMTRGKIALRPTVVDIAQIIEAAVEMSRPLLESASHRLTVTLPSESIPVEADVTRLTQVFSNLLNNAANYTDPGGNISIAARRDNGDVVVSVTDTGIGIPAEALSKVFDMFAQVADRSHARRAGLGIGLTLARSLVTLHGGQLTAESDGPGKGSRFTVRLPVSKREETQPASSAERTAASVHSQRILVVDDNRDAAASLGALLTILGAEVRVVHDGPSALEAFDQFHPQVTLLDLGMPGMDGYEVARRIRAHPDSGQTALIALTGWGQERDRRRTTEAGFDCHLTKPVDIDTVTAALASVVR